MNVFKKHSKVHSGGESKDLSSVSDRGNEADNEDDHISIKGPHSISNVPSTDGSMTDRKSIMSALVGRFRSSKYSKV